MKKAANTCLIILVLLSFARVTIGDDAVSTSEQESAIRSAAKAYRNALRRGDVKTLAASWTDDGVYIDAAGESSSIRSLLQQFSKEAVATQSADADFNSSIRFVTPKVAVEEGQAADAGSTERYTAIWVKTDRDWRLARLRDWDSTANKDQNPLAALSWLVGEWVGKGNGFEVRCSVSWSENKRFILRRFRVQQADGETISGTQRIGWDPSTNRVRSWVFDSTGGIVEGRWTREGDAWIVKANGVLADGSTSTAISFWIPEGTDRCVLKTSHAKVDGVSLDDAVVEFERVRTPMTTVNGR